MTIFEAFLAAIRGLASPIVFVILGIAVAVTGAVIVIGTTREAVIEWTFNWVIAAVIASGVATFIIGLTLVVWGGSSASPFSWEAQ